MTEAMTVTVTAQLTLSSGSSSAVHGLDSPEQLKVKFVCTAAQTAVTEGPAWGCAVRWQFGPGPGTHLCAHLGPVTLSSLTPATFFGGRH